MAAIVYSLKGAALIAPPMLCWPTPCAAWDLGMLLRHLATSMIILTDALGAGWLGATDPGHSGKEPPRQADPVEDLRDRAAALLMTAFTPGLPAAVQVSGILVPAALVVDTATVEITVHGWDIWVACGNGRPVPAWLARPLLAALPALITSRAGLFGPPAAVPPCATPGDKLIAALGRDPASSRLFRYRGGDGGGGRGQAHRGGRAVQPGHGA